MIIETKCKRCGVLIDVDAAKRFNNGIEDEGLENFVWKYADGPICCDCPVCKKWTVQEIVYIPFKREL